MEARELHITCTGCGIIRVVPVRAVTPAQYGRLKCARCGARDPRVTEQKQNIPFTAGFKHWR